MLRTGSSSLSQIFIVRLCLTLVSILKFIKSLRGRPEVGASERVCIARQNVYDLSLRVSASDKVPKVNCTSVKLYCPVMQTLSRKFATC